ncbi:MAG: branched-chain amino acid ABC transporter permease [Alphaproteobacteria bacterium]|nr:branched-chain amino acid ABC transporter permease [Alphaproteobacteria bacterium]
MILQGVASGLVTGSVYALIALSLVIVFKSTEVINFAGGEFVMLGAYVAMFFLVLLGLPYIIVVPVVALIVFCIGAAFDRVILDRVLGRHRPGQSIMVAMVIATVGLSFAFKGTVRLFRVSDNVRTLPPIFSTDPVFLGQVVLSRQDIAIFVIAVAVMVLLFSFFQFTKLGRALRATSENPRAATLVGIPVRRMRTLIWGIAAALSAVAGVLVAPKLLVSPDMGGVIILAFAAAIIGGFTNVLGVIVGGVVLGVIENLVGLFVSSKAIAIAPFIVIILILMVRPQGLFGGAAPIKKV